MALVAASSSSSSRRSETKTYDVFLSFRGEDTRNNFTSHLYADLCRKKIETFIDNDSLRRGEEISQSLLKATKESKIAIVVFSEGYPSSTWCLEELAKIIEYKKSGDLIVVPVFYHVDPSDVRKQTGSFGEAFVKHEESFEQSLEKVQKWRAALTETANISGFDSEANRPEAALIEKIIKQILERLNHMSPCYNKDLVGIEPRIKTIEFLLNLESKDVILVEIWGMRGMGKTTLARAIFNKIRSGFEGAVFLDKVTEESQNFGLSHLRQTLLSGILDDPNASLESTFSKNRLSNKKILLVFDDVTDWEDIERLIGDLKCFGPKSRIILTARDKQVLKNCEVEHDNIYEIKGLHHNDAFKLFSRHAFKLDHPIASYEMLSKKVVVFGKGVPLALKVLGGLLFGKTNVEWESALANLEKNPEPKINNVLKLTYDRLNDQEKNIFIDSACFFKGVERDFLIKILDVNEFTLANLIDKSLIKIDYNHIRMHDLLQNMGRKIVEQESKYPGGRSRLWHHDDIRRVLRTNTGTQAIEGILLDMSKIRVINLNRNAFSKMCMLRYFDFYWSGTCQQRTCFVSHDCRFLVCCRRSSSFFFLSPKRYKGWVHAPEGLEFASSKLRFFRWVGYPLESLPSNFDSGNLIALLMPYSNIKQLSEGFQYSETLTHINLMYCKHVIRISNLSLTPNLESLILEGCTNLIEVPSMIQSLDKLVTLNLNGCTSLRSLPTGISIKFLSLIGYSNLDMAPEITSKMEKLYLDGTAIKELSVIKLPSRLKILSLRNCSRLESLSNAICELKSLKDLHMTGCPKLDRMPLDFGNLEALESLYVDHTAIRRVPSSICRSKRPASPTSLGLISLSRLNLSCCQITELPDNLGELSSLEYLHLSGNYFACIPPSVEKLSKLSELHVRYCEKLQFLPKVSSMVPCVVDATGSEKIIFAE